MHHNRTNPGVSLEPRRACLFIQAGKFPNLCLQSVFAYIMLG
jgi:hypothetical protein